MHRIIKYIFVLTIIYATFTSCTNDFSNVGLDLLSPDELLKTGYTDTTSIIAYTVHDDSLNTSGAQIVLIGSMYDPVFGITDASLYTQIRPSSNSMYFDNSATFDSAYFLLPFVSGKYGDTMSNMHLQVFMITEDFPDTLNFHSNYDMKYDKENVIGEIVFQPGTYHKSYHNGTQVAALKIPINEKFANKILKADTSDLNTIDKFLKYFKGIHVKAKTVTNSGQGALVSFYAPNEYSRLELFYHDSKDTSSLSFVINQTNKRYVKYEHHNYNQATEPLKLQLAGDTTLGKDLLFLQATNGTKVKLQFPHLKDLAKNQRIAINDAQLIISDASASGLYKQPGKLALHAAGELGTTNPYPIIDQGSTYYDGKLNKSSNSYRFRITRYVQQLVDNKVDNRNGIFIIIPEINTGSRLVLYGTNSHKAQIKLYIKYTVIN